MPDKTYSPAPDPDWDEINQPLDFEEEPWDNGSDSEEDDRNDIEEEQMSKKTKSVIYRNTKVWKLARDYFRSGNYDNPEGAATIWFNIPCPALGDQRPSDFMQTLPNRKLLYRRLLSYLRQSQTTIRFGNIVRLP